MKPLVAIVAWVLAASLEWLPVPAVNQPGPFGGLALNGETQDEYAARRASMASDFVEVAFDPAEKPVFDGPDGRARTALFLMSIARFESGYDLRVDNGKQLGKQGEVCSLQVMVDWRYVKGVGMVTKEGWSAADLAADRKKCARAALHKLQVSQAICSDAKSPLNASKKSLSGSDVFTLYTGTRCSEGSPFAKHRYEPVLRWSAKSPAPAASSSAAPASSL